MRGRKFKRRTFSGPSFFFGKNRAEFIRIFFDPRTRVGNWLCRQGDFFPGYRLMRYGGLSANSFPELCRRLPNDLGKFTVKLSKALETDLECDFTDWPA